jgi:hypothetical protein
MKHINAQAAQAVASTLRKDIELSIRNILSLWHESYELPEEREFWLDGSSEVVTRIFVNEHNMLMVQTDNTVDGEPLTYRYDDIRSMDDKIEMLSVLEDSLVVNED